ncbi:hypothetical protein KFL_006890070 [Klebsormidium nitens]|uniref:Dynein axonemal assembly factor 11-like CS domain-containing protein n=1 Tax=Klebsormidium nitens TaxID=105231 RepID=A0A1Y1IKY9_KLENI|nr:hypothetical protein KFL_006890070 [Klebsormidium nitens]|eukprot:GAQ90822.1 hypothetical protein KFL_006890070 [Klebsormidium nitens]
MAPITHAMLQKRAEHNEGIVSTLKEVSLHQQDIERIEGLGQLCRQLEILYLQNNLISKIENLERLKELNYLNLAVNNITRIEGLERCESLRKLDLTVNFVDKAGLLTIQRLRTNAALRELYLTGNPCQDVPGYRQYVVASLPALQRLDGVEITASERIAAAQALPAIHAQLQAELEAEGVDVPALLRPTARRGGPAATPPQEAHDELEPAWDAAGEAVRPYSAATRLAEHREMAALRAKAQEQQERTREGALAGESRPPPRQGFDPLPTAGRIYQKNEGRWDFTLGEAADGAACVLDVAVGRFLDSSLLAVDVQPRLVRVLIKGRLLQLALAAEVCTSRSVAQRSQTTGHLVVTMPLAYPHLVPNPVLAPPRAPLAARDSNGRGSRQVEERGGRGGAVSTRILAPENSEAQGKPGPEQGADRRPAHPGPRAGLPEKKSSISRSGAADTDIPPLE